MNPSIKDIEHVDRDAVSPIYEFSGPSQQRPTDLRVALKNSSFDWSFCKNLEGWFSSTFF